MITDLDRRIKWYISVLNGDIQTDADLTARLTVTYQDGVCVKGKPIKEVFPFFRKC